jgi:hypothetical protein
MTSPSLARDYPRGLYANLTNHWYTIAFIRYINYSEKPIKYTPTLLKLYALLTIQLEKFSLQAFAGYRFPFSLDHPS